MTVCGREMRRGVRNTVRHAAVSYVEHPFDFGLGIVGAEDGVARYQYIGARIEEQAGVVRRDAAVDLDQRRQACFVDRAPQLCDLTQCAVHELLSAEARFDAHHEHQVERRQQVAQYFDRGGRLDRDAGPRPCGVNFVDAAVCGVGGFVVKRHDVGARFGEALDLLLKPFKENIADFRTRVEQIYSTEREQHGELKGELKNLMELNRRITAETTNLTNALKGNSKVQGDWGEMILSTILDNSNLIRGVHYDCQVTIKDDEGNNQRPDVVLYLPEGKRIVIDSKVSLTAYVEWVGAEEEAARTRYLAAHVASVRQHVNELSRKEYQRLLESPDFVIMFIPNEPAFLAAMQHDSAIWSDAYERKVIISSPTNLFALLKLVDDLWRRNEQSRNQEQIIKYGTTLYEQFVAFAASLEGVGQALDLARAKYDDAYKRLHTGNNNIVRTGERLRRLGLPTAKRPSRRLLDETDGLDAEEELPAAGDGGHDRL